MGQYRATQVANVDGQHTIIQTDQYGNTKVVGLDGGPISTTGGVGVTLIDASIANAAGTSETIAALSTTRNVLIVANPSATVSWWINASGGTAAANTAGSFELPPGAVWTPHPAPRNAVTGVATANTDLTVKVG
jgi:hypothetical protein